MSENSLELEVLMNPLPLHEFWPIHPLLAVLHELWPLQLLPPIHFTLAPLAEPPEELCARTGVARNIAPTAAAKIAPVTILRSIVVILLSGFARADALPSIEYMHPIIRIRPADGSSSTTGSTISFASSLVKSRP